MKPSDRLKEIEESHHPFQNKFADPDAIYWLIARVKNLTETLEVMVSTNLDITADYEQMKFLVRKALEDGS